MPTQPYPRPRAEVAAELMRLDEAIQEAHNVLASHPHDKQAYARSIEWTQREQACLAELRAIQTS